jgi:cytochrome c oxidase cbb3-type subunit 1
VNPRVATAVRRHSLAWLAAANLVGVLLATLLLWPELNDRLAPLTYGRWMPLHLDWQLYGWCALPLVGVLCAHYLPDDDRAAFAARLTLAVWSAGLVLGAVSWLGGHVGGKLFLDWTGVARDFWVLVGFLLWVTLMLQARRRGEVAPWAWGLLVLLGAVPVLLQRAEQPESFPPVNPHSGGATGASLLGSTLGVVAIFGLIPWLLRLRVASGGWSRRWFVAVLALELSLFAGIGHGDASHHRPDQIIGLGSLLIWLPVAWAYARRFIWSPVSHRWLAAAFVWWCFLVVTGWLTFLPGISERVKFTNFLVGHSHLAMAGLVTSLHVALLLNLGPVRAPSARSFWLWQVGCAVHVAVLFWLGWSEGVTPGLLYLRGGFADACYGLRWLAGIAMFAASVSWLANLGRHVDEPT